MVRRRGLAAVQAFARGNNVSRCFGPQIVWKHDRDAVASLPVPQRTFTDSFPHYFFQAQALGAEPDFIHRIGFGLPRLHSTGFRLLFSCPLPPNSKRR